MKLLSAGLVLMLLGACDGGQTAATISRLEAELTAAREAVEARTSEVQELQARVAELERTPEMVVKTQVEQLHQADGILAVQSSISSAQDAARSLLDSEAKEMLLQEIYRAESELERMKEMQSFQRDFASSLGNGEFANARRLLRQHSHLISEDQRSKQAQEIVEAEHKPVSVTLELMENFGHEYVGKRVKLDVTYDGLTQSRVKDMPSVRGQYMSPEGLLRSFNSAAAHEWIGFMASDSTYSVFTQMIAPRSLKSKLLSLSRDSHMTVIGTVFAFGFNDWHGVLVDTIN